MPWPVATHVSMVTFLLTSNRNLLTGRICYRAEFDSHRERRGHLVSSWHNRRRSPAHPGETGRILEAGGNSFLGTEGEAAHQMTLEDQDEDESWNDG